MATTPPERNQTVFLTQSVSGNGNASNLSKMHVLPKNYLPYRCGVCSISFSVNTDLVVHVEAHFVNKPYQCGYCTVSYEANPDLLSHVKTHKLFLCLPSDSLPVSSHTDTVGQGKDTEVCGQHGPGMTTHTQGEDKGGETETHTTCTVLKGRTLSSDCQQTADNASLSSCAVDDEDDDGDDYMDDDDKHGRTNDQLKGDSEQPAPDSLPLKKEIHSDNHYSCEIAGRNSGPPQSVCLTESHHHLTANQGDNSERTDFLASSASVNSEDINLQCHFLPVSDRPVKYRSHELSSGSHSQQGGVRKVEPQSPQNIQQGCSESPAETSPVCRCGECDAVFPSILALTHHWDSCHSACTVCSERFSDPLHLQLHLKSAHGEDKGRKYRPFLCGLCGADFMVAKYLPPHIRDVHKVQLNASNSRSDSIKVFDCPVCPEQFESKTQVMAHIHSKHWADGRFQCPVCEKTYKHLTHLKYHYKTCHVHPDWRPHECPQCDKTFKQSVHLKIHIQSIHQGERPHHCSTCGSSFKTRSGLRRHVRNSSHSHLKSSSTDTGVSRGGKATGDQTQKRSAARRKRTKRQNAKTMCHICGKAVTHLRSHLAMRHSDAKPFKCSLCDRAYKTTQLLEIHMRTHTKEKPFVCETCGRSFALKNTLTDHRNTHTNARPYRCEVCDKGFNFYSAMRMHLRGHKGDKRYSCDLCGKKFIASGGLQRHILTHTDQRPWSCDKCGKTYRSISSLRYHEARCYPSSSAFPS